MYVCIYIYIFMYSIHLDLYNVGFQGNQVQIYSICTLLHLFIKNVKRKHSPSISCLVLAQYMLKNIVYIYLKYVYICTYTIQKIQNQQCWLPNKCCELKTHISNIFGYVYQYIPICIYIYLYFCTYLDLYNVSFQGNRIQIYSICTLLHLSIKEPQQKTQPIHFLPSSCAIYTE